VSHNVETLPSSPERGIERAARLEDDDSFVELAQLLGITPLELMERHLRACKRAMLAWQFDDVDDVGQMLLMQAARHVDSAIVCVRLTKDEPPSPAGEPGGPATAACQDSVPPIVARPRENGT
jgi:hypothetical protein